MHQFNLKSFFHLLAILLIIAVAVAGYSNSFSGPFLFDDYHNIIGNKHMQVSDLSFESLRNAAVEGPSKHRWIPKASFAINYYFADKKAVDYHSTMSSGTGLNEPESWGYHLVNLLVHIATAISLYFLFRLTLSSKLLKRDFKYKNEVALLAAIIWAVHPVQTNAVTYIVQRMTGMGALFSIMTILFYVLGRIRGLKGIGGYALFASSLFSWFLALVSKENAAILPAVVVGYELYFLGGTKVSLKNRKTFLWLAAAVVLVIGMGWLYLGRNPFSIVLSGYGGRDFTLAERLLTQPRVVLHYLSLLLLPLPSRLTLAYDYPISTGLFVPPATILAILCLLVMAFLIFFLFKRERMLSFAIFWFLANLAIESSFIPLEIIFEHRVYMPSAFLVLALVHTLYRYSSLKQVNLARTGVCLVAVLLVFFTWQRNQTWSSREGVWGDVAAKSPNLTRGHMGLYVTYKAQNRNAEALEALNKAVAVGPDEFRPSFNLANYYKENRQYKQAQQILNNMLKKKHLQTAPAYQLRAAVYLDLKNYRMAINDALKAIEADPEHVNSLLILGSAYFRLNNFKQSAKYFEIARELMPDTYGVYYNLGTVYYNQGNYDKAIVNYKRALDFMPNNADIHYNLGMVYGAKGMVREMQQEMAISQRLKGQIK
jgi:tetratricopeptide (TPR) repeat protein